MAGGVIAAMTIANRLVLALLMIPQVSLGPTFLQMAMNVLIYPLLAYAMQIAFDLRRAATGEVDEFGQRI